MGDYNGIGPEVILKAFQRIDLTETTPVVTGAIEVFEHYNSQLVAPVPLKEIRGMEELQSSEEEETLQILRSLDSPIDIKPSVISGDAGEAAMKAVGRAVDLCLDGQAQAMVTAPISKEAIQLAGHEVPGHTEFLASRTGTDHVQMILVNRQLRVALATIHEPLKRVASLITESMLLRQLQLLDSCLKSDFLISEPVIAVLGLNPHAGDGGVLGDEEQTILKPVLERASEKNIRAEGPFPADGFFGNRSWQQFDATLAMYHDQGLIPFKTLSFGSGVNFTAGLPIIRTSPDHGTGLDIAGKGVASEDSFLSAYDLAAELALRKIQKQKSE